jgi:hypothetical protein
MLLPNRTEAYLPREKLTGYLLSQTHAVGKSKAQFFRAHGYSEQTVDRFEHDLLDVVRTNDVQQVAESPHGTKYVVDGILETPRGTLVEIRTVWIIGPDERPRFVTAYPR